MRFLKLIGFLQLKVGFNDIITQLERQQKIAVDEIQEKIERLKEFFKISILRCDVL